MEMTVASSRRRSGLHATPMAATVPGTVTGSAQAAAWATLPGAQSASSATQPVEMEVDNSLPQSPEIGSARVAATQTSLSAQNATAAMSRRAQMPKWPRERPPSVAEAVDSVVVEEAVDVEDSVAAEAVVVEVDSAAEEVVVEPHVVAVDSGIRSVAEIQHHLTKRSHLIREMLRVKVEGGEALADKIERNVSIWRSERALQLVESPKQNAKYELIESLSENQF